MVLNAMTADDYRQAACREIETTAGPGWHSSANTWCRCPGCESWPQPRDRTRAVRLGIRTEIRTVKNRDRWSYNENPAVDFTDRLRTIRLQARLNGSVHPWDLESARTLRAQSLARYQAARLP